MWPGPSSSAIGTGERSMREWQASGRSGVRELDAGAAFTSPLPVPRLLPIRGNPADQRAIRIEASVAQRHSLVGDLVFANVLAVLAVAHLDDGEDAAKHAVEIEVAQPDDVVGQKRDQVVAEAELGERLVQLDRAQDRHARSR